MVSPNRSHGQAAAVKPHFLLGGPSRDRRSAAGPPVPALEPPVPALEPLVTGAGSSAGRSRDGTSSGTRLAPWCFSCLVALILQFWLLLPGMEIAFGNVHLVLTDK